MPGYTTPDGEKHTETFTRPPKPDAAPAQPKPAAAPAQPKPAAAPEQAQYERPDYRRSFFMTTLTIRPELLKGGLRIESKEDGDVFVFPENGGCMELPELPGARERFLVFRLHLLEAHSGAFELRFFGRRRGNECSVRFGVLPDADTLICIDMNWLSASQLFPGSTRASSRWCATASACCRRSLCARSCAPCRASTSSMCA